MLYEITYFKSYEEYVVSDCLDFGKQLISNCVSCNIKFNPKNWLSMRIEIEDDKKGLHNFNVTKNFIYDSYQIWQNTTVGPMCWTKMNKQPIKNDLIRNFYDDHVKVIKSRSSSKFTKYNLNDDQFLSDED